MYDDAASVLATINEQADQARQRAAAATRFRMEVEATRGSASSPDRTVTVTVDASGMVLDLDITDGATNRRGHDLARLVRETIYAAQRSAADAVNAKAAETFGADSPVTARMRDELSLRFVEPESDGGSLTLGTTR